MRLKRAERSVACELGIRPAVPSSGFQGKIARVFTEPSSCRHTYEPPTNDSSNLVRNPPGEISLTSDFWRLFFSSTNPILPPIQNTSPKFDSNSPTSEIAYPLYDTANETIHYTITPFTQKLFHACAESGHRYLTISSVSDVQMWPEFGLLLEYIPRQEIILYFERVLHMTPCNPVKNSRFPFISLGGAGMQFQAYETVNLLTSRRQMGYGLFRVRSSGLMFGILRGIWLRTELSLDVMTPLYIQLKKLQWLARLPRWFREIWSQFLMNGPLLKVCFKKNVLLCDKLH